MTPRNVRRRARGSAYVLAVILLAVFAALVVSYARFTDMNARMSGNASDLQRARLAAESGLAFGTKVIRGARLPKNTDASNVIAHLAVDIAARLNGTVNFGGASVSSNPTTVYLPRVETEDGAFEIRITRTLDKVLHLQVMGMGVVARHVVAVELRIVSEPRHTAFNYGIASMGPVVLDGNAQIRGKNAMTEASIISATQQTVAVTVSGSAVVEGDVSSVGADTSVVLNGTPTIAGSQDPAVIAQHIHLGVDPPVFPRVDTSVFRSLTTSVVDSSKDFNQPGMVLNNVLVKAGTNPTFTKDVTINGVIYIESPNIVSFGGSCTLNGIMATDDTAQGIQNNKISFTGAVNAFGVEALPDTPEFASVKQLEGTFICAPGFAVHIGGEFTTINGTMAADKLTFSGAASGTVRGSVIGLSDYPVSVDGEVSILIDRSGASSGDPGLELPALLDVSTQSYKELRVSDWQ